MSLELAGICGREARLGLQLACWDRVGLGSEEGLASRGSVPPPWAQLPRLPTWGSLTALIYSRRVSCPWLGPLPTLWPRSLLLGLLIHPATFGGKRKE